MSFDGLMLYILTKKSTALFWLPLLVICTENPFPPRTLTSIHLNIFKCWFHLKYPVLSIWIYFDIWCVRQYIFLCLQIARFFNRFRWTESWCSIGPEKAGLGGGRRKNLVLEGFIKLGYSEPWWIVGWGPGKETRKDKYLTATEWVLDRPTFSFPTSEGIFLSHSDLAWGQVLHNCGSKSKSTKILEGVEKYNSQVDRSELEDLSAAKLTVFLPRSLKILCAFLQHYTYNMVLSFLFVFFPLILLLTSNKLLVKV